MNASENRPDVDSIAPGRRRKETTTKPKAWTRQGVVTRLWKTAERQVEEIEVRIGEISGDPQALEREAKILAIIAKTIRDLVAIDLEASTERGRGKVKDKAAKHGAKDANDAEDVQASFAPRNIEEFRTELARRLDQLREERAGAAAS